MTEEIVTEEGKEILLVDLCGRIPYNTKLKAFDVPDIDFYLYSISSTDIVAKTAKGGVICMSIEGFKPYLFPLSSMTEEQRNELKKYTCPDGTGYFKEDHLCCPINHVGEQIPFIFMSKIIEWLDRNHFDYRYLIEKGLAIDATNLDIY